MLESIRLIKFFFMTGLGESTTFIGSDIMQILYGMSQGNGVAPVVWLVMSLIAVWAYKMLELSTQIQDSITRAWLDIMGTLYIDKTNLYIMDASIFLHYDLW